MSWGFLLLPDEVRLFNAQFGVEVVRNLIKVELVTLPGRMKKQYTKFDACPLKVYRGNRESFEFDVTLNKSPFDLSNYNVTFQAKKTEKAQTNLANFPILDAILGNDFANGKVILILNPDVTTILPSLCMFEIKAVSKTDADDVVTIAFGEINTHERVNI